jgi:hypothetical protein
MFILLTTSLGERHPDCLFDPERPLNTPHSSFTKETKSNVVADRIQEYITQETAATAQIRSRPSSQAFNEEWRQESESSARSFNWDSTKLEDNTQRFVKVKPPKPQPLLPAFQKSRLLLSHLGFLNFGGLKDNSFHMLTKTPALFRDIKGLDKKLGRETVKVAVLYVKQGQETEQSILGNENGSAQYDNFVKSLGWEVRHVSTNSL